MKKQRVEVELFGKAGQRNTSVETYGVFPTRHVSTGSPTETEPLTITPNPEPDIFTKATLTGIISKMTAQDKADGSKAGGWLCEDSIYKVARVNLKHNVTSRVLCQMLSDLTACGTLEYKKAYGLRKFRLTPSKPLKGLIQEVDAILAGGVDNA